MQPSWFARYRKFLIAAAAAGGIAALQVFADGSLDPGDIWTIVIAGAAAVGVVVTPNARPVTTRGLAADGSGRLERP